MDENPKNKKRGRRRLIRFACSILSLAVLTYIAVALISGRQTGLFSFFGLFSKSDPVELADEYHFDVGRGRVFADLGDSLAAAGTLGVQVLDAAGGETLRDSYRMARPAISYMNGYAVAFDIGGTSARVFSKTEIIAAIEAPGAIISASINKNGWFSVCTQGGANSPGIITAYNSKGTEVYKVYLASGYILSSELSPDNRSLAILNITAGGSRITYYNLNNEDVDRVFDLPGGLIIDFRYLANGDSLAISTESLFIVNKSNVIKELYEFSGKHLGSYAFGDGFVVLCLLDYGVGYRGRLVTIKEDGSLLGEIESDKEALSIVSGDEYIAVLRNDKLAFYDTGLGELPAPDEAAASIGATRILALGAGAILATSDNSAVVIRIIM